MSYYSQEVPTQPQFHHTNSQMIYSSYQNPNHQYVQSTVQLNPYYI